MRSKIRCLPTDSRVSFIQTRNHCFTLFLCLFISACSSPVKNEIHLEPETGTSGVEGSVLTTAGKPATGAFVYAYRSARQGLRGPADFGVRVETDGRYFLDLTEGKYYLVARLRRAGADAGPPRPGDAWALYHGNPIVIEQDEIAAADFILQPGAAPRQLRQGSLTSGDTGFSGILIDAGGQPMAGAFVLAYRSPDFHRMPDLTSRPADEDGSFVLFVPEPGRYCLAARLKTRGQPRVGEPYGILGEGEAACRDVMAGDILDVGTIELAPFR